jgi:hypothetical protein
MWSMRPDALLELMREAVRAGAVSSVGAAGEPKRRANKRRGDEEVEVEGFEEWDRARRAAAVRGVAFRADDFR